MQVWRLPERHSASAASAVNTGAAEGHQPPAPMLRRGTADSLYAAQGSRLDLLGRLGSSWRLLGGQVYPVLAEDPNEDDLP